MPKNKRSLVGARVELSPGYDLWMRGARFGVIRKVESGVATVKMDHPAVKRLQRIPLKDLRSTSHGSQYGGLVSDVANFLAKSVGSVLRAAAPHTKRGGRARDDMSRTGVPMYAPAQECVVFVTVEEPGQPVRIRTWRTRKGGLAAIKRAAKRAYPNAKLHFGSSMWNTI